MQDESFTKVLIKYHSSVLEEITVETLWVTTVDEKKGLYKIDNIPFYGPLLAPGDTVFAELDENEGMLTYKKTVEYGGSSVVLVVLMDETTDVEKLRKEFAEIGCESEGTGKRYFSMEIPRAVDYSKVRAILNDYTSKGILEYSEPCLSAQHLY
jgi:hypothetical protein